MPDYEQLRRASEAPVPWRRGVVTLVRVRDGGQSSSNTVAGKQRMLTEAAPTDLLLAAWTGRHRTDVLVVDDRAAVAQAVA